MRPKRNTGLLAAAAIAALLAASAVYGATPPKPSLFVACQKRHTCPSNRHAYVWHGLSCGTHRDAANTLRVGWHGRTWYCHRVASKARPSPPSATTTTDATTTPAPTPTNCTRDTGYRPAAALPISTSQPGLQQVIDPPYLYRVYGSTAGEVRSQIDACKPTFVGDSDAYTAYWVNWAYSYGYQPDGSCRLARVAVGLHVNMAMPAWTAGPGAEAGLASRWQTYVANLTTHEQGHVALAVQYAQKLLSDLQSVTVADCTSILGKADSVGYGDLAALKQANLDYAARTNHGATQGATFP